MAEEQQQSSKEYSYGMVTLPNTVPLVPHNQATVPQDCAIFQDGIFMPPPAAHPPYFEPHRGGYAQYYGPITPSVGTTHINRYTPCAPQTANQLNNVAPAQPCCTVTAAVDEPPIFDIPFGGMAENTGIAGPSGRRPKRNRQDFNDAGYNPVVPGTSMANIYRDLRDLIVRLINDPQSNVIITRIEPSGDRSRVMMELEIPHTA